MRRSLQFLVLTRRTTVKQLSDLLPEMPRYRRPVVIFYFAFLVKFSATCQGRQVKESVVKCLSKDTTK